MATTIKYVALLRKYEELKPCAEFAADSGELTKLIEIYEELTAVPDLARRFEPLLRRIIQIMREVAEMPPAYVAEAGRLDKSNEAITDAMRFILSTISPALMARPMPPSTANLHGDVKVLTEFAHTVAAEVMDKMREVFPMAPNALTDASIKAAAEKFKPKLLYETHELCFNCVKMPVQNCIKQHPQFILERCSKCFMPAKFNDIHKLMSILETYKKCNCNGYNNSYIMIYNDTILSITDPDLFDSRFDNHNYMFDSYTTDTKRKIKIDSFGLHYNMVRQYERHMVTRGGEYQTPPFDRILRWQALSNPTKIAELLDSQDIAAEKNEARRFARIMPLTRENLFGALAERLEPYFYICAQLSEMMDSVKALAEKTEPGAAELAKVRQSIERMRILIMDANGEFDWALIGRIVRNPPVTTLFDTNNVVDKILTTPKLLREILEIELLCDSAGLPVC